MLNRKIIKAVLIELLKSFFLKNIPFCFPLVIVNISGKVNIENVSFLTPRKVQTNDLLTINLTQFNFIRKQLKIFLHFQSAVPVVVFFFRIKPYLLVRLKLKNLHSLEEKCRSVLQRPFLFKHSI